MPKRKNENAPYWTMLRDSERHIIAYALEQGGTITKAAQLLGISVNYLSERTRELGVPAPNKGNAPGKKRPAPPTQVEARPGLTLVPDPAEPAPAPDDEDPDAEDGEDDGEDDAEDGNGEDEGEDDEGDDEEVDDEALDEADKADI